MIRPLLLALLLATPLAAQEAPDAASPWIAVARGVVDVPGGLMRLAAQREGLIAEVMAEEGDHVIEGQPLARIDDVSARLALEIAEGEVAQSGLARDLAKLRAEQAEAEVNRLRPLAKADAVPRRQLEEAQKAASLAALEAKTAEGALALAEKRVETQRQDVAARTVRAPVAGVILRRTARKGDGATTQTVSEMFLLAPDGGRVLRAQLDEQFVGIVTPGQKAEIIRERDDGSVLKATVARVAPVFGSVTAGTSTQRPDDARTVEITLTLDGPPEAIKRLVLGQRMIARILK